MNFDIERHPLDQAIIGGGMQISPASEYGRELAKWEQHRTKYVADEAQPGNPYVKREFPKMVYRATQHPMTGKGTCMHAVPSPWEFVHISDREARAEAYKNAVDYAENWNLQHQRVVKDESERLVARGQGWYADPIEALEAYEKQQIDIAEAAAQVAYHAQGMSDKARAELRAADADTDAHVVDVQPKKRGRKPKAVTAAGPVEE